MEFKNVKIYRVKNVEATLTPATIYPKLMQDPYYSKSPEHLEGALMFLTILNNHSTDLIREVNQSHWIEIHSQLIQKYFGSNYTLKSIEKLIELNIIERDEKYIKGKRDMKYKLADEYLNCKSIARRLKRKRSFTKIKNIENYFLKKLNDPILFQVYHNLKKIKIDEEKAIKKIYERKANGEFELTENQQKCYLQKMNAVNLGYNHAISLSESNGRLFNNFVNLPKLLREFLFVVDDETGEVIEQKIELDGKNTQPILLSLMMKKEIEEYDKEFFELCLGGKIYDVIAEELKDQIFIEKSEEIDENKERRNWVKTRFMDTLMFTKSNSERTISIRNPNLENKQKKIFTSYFKNRFPIFYNWLLNKKKKLANGENKFYENSGGSKLALIIQRMESKLWIQGLLKEVIKEYGDQYVYYTIHDSIMVFNPNPEIEDFIRTKFAELSFNLYGFTMPLK